MEKKNVVNISFYKLVEAFLCFAGEANERWIRENLSVVEKLFNVGDGSRLYFPEKCEQIKPEKGKLQ